MVFKRAFADIIEVRVDRFGPYVKVKVDCVDGPAVIRWGLDAVTFEHISEVIRQHATASDSQPNGACRLSLRETAAVGESCCGWLAVMTQNGWTRVPFACSPLFLSNAAWLCQVQSRTDLADVLWMDVPAGPASESEFTEMNSRQATMTAGRNRRETRSKRSSVVSRKQGFGAAVAGFAMLGTVGAAGYWYSASHADASYAAQMSGRLTAAGPANETPNHRTESPAMQNSTDTPSLNNTPAVPDAGEKGEPPVSDISSVTPVTTAGVKEVYQVGPGEVALTFDDGPSPYTAEIVDILNQYHVHGTFFFIGNRVSQWSDAVKSAIASGNVVGNHSESHPDLVKLPLSSQEAQIRDCALALQQVENSPVNLFRPPYGAYNQETLSLLKSDHYALALWNRDPRDWAAHSPQDIVNAVLSDHPSGGVFDLHDTKMTAEALPDIIEGLQKANLKLVVLSGQ